MSRALGTARSRLRGVPLPLMALVIVGGFMAPLVLYGSLVRSTIDRDLSDRNVQDRMTIARTAAASVQAQLADASDDLVFLANSPTLVAGLRARDRNALNARLGDFLRGRQRSLGAVLDPAGIVVAAPLAPDLVGLDFSRREYFQGALRGPGAFVSDVFTSASPGAPTVVAISVAIRDGPALIGVAVLTLSPIDLLQVLEPLRQVEGRDLLLVDHSGQVVATTAPGLAPLSATGLSIALKDEAEVAVQVAGRDRVATVGTIDRARWLLYVLDDPGVIYGAQRKLLAELRGGGAAIGVVALISAIGFIVLYAKTVRQRDEIRASRAALADTNRALEEASRHKSDFLASMSHELRTPLNAILGFSDLLSEQLDRSLTDRQRRYLGNIADAGRHLLGLINDVLDLSKVEAGRMTLRPETVSLESVVAPVVQSTRAAADGAGIRFDVLLPTDAVVTLDLARSRQILYNLLSNAVKFTGRGGRIELSFQIEDRALVIAVSDTGIGIPDDKGDRVFGTFERLHEGRSEATGTGLGLALTKQLVELHGGTIGVASREGEGTVFTVRLPNAVAPAGGDSRILIVEDDPRDADLVAEIASSNGLASEVVASVGAAVAALRRGRPTAVVLDLRLGDERGEAVLEALRADPAMSGTPVVVVTVEDDEGLLRRMGAEDQITKPIDRGRLGRWMRAIATRRSGEEIAIADPVGG